MDTDKIKGKEAAKESKKNQRYVLDGYSFASREDYEQAKKEAESIVYVRSELDINNDEALFQTYQKLTDKAQYRTPIGLGFLREMQRHLARKEETRKKLTAIPVPSSDSGEAEMSPAERRKRAFAVNEEKNIRREVEAEYRGRMRNLRIVIGFLAALVILLFAVTWQDKHVDIQEERDKILNEYAGWKEELEQWEEELDDREAALKALGY